MSQLFPTIVDPISSRILNGLRKKFPIEQSARVVDCFDRFVQVLLLLIMFNQLLCYTIIFSYIEGKDLDVYLGDGKSEHNRQVANCYVEDLSLLPFHDVYSGRFEWFEHVLLFPCSL